ncbi:MAG: alcohol dehydrogenase [Spirochaetaceae bacterium]|nr:MAG: alcohol dehydrogenase [Spirochaetaceae bacterium]
MYAVVYCTFRGPIEYTKVPDPGPSRTGVVIRVEATGLCRSDWHGWMGHDPDIRLPHVPGHELAGTIVACGADVKNWKSGARVTLPFVCGCGCCPPCAAGNQHVCDHQFQPGFTAWGSFAEYVAIEYADGNLVALPDSMSAVTAASLGCRFATAFRALVDLARLTSGEWVAVHGCGGVGLSAIMIAVAAGARVIAVDVRRTALDLARELGAVAFLDGSACAGAPDARGFGDGERVGDAVRDISGGGVDVSIDALGSPETCMNSVLSLRKRGRHVQVGLLLAGQSRPALPMDRVVAWELQLFGSHGIQAHRYPALLALIESGTLDPGRLIGDTIPLSDAPAALAGMNRFEHHGITVIDGMR